MSSAVDISNLALSHIGERAEVIDINPPDNSAEAQHCARFYPMARNDLLSKHPWTFATRRVVLAELTSDRPAWQYAYAKPSGCIRPLSVLAADVYEDAKSDDYIVESTDTGAGVIYTNRPEATLRYISLVEDTTKFTPGFVLALSRLLASMLAGPIIKGKDGMAVAQGQLKIFLIELADAKVEDSNTGKRNAYSDRVPDIVKARGGPGNGFNQGFGWGQGYR